jgi:hypothetical protein
MSVEDSSALSRCKPVDSFGLLSFGESFVRKFVPTRLPSSLRAAAQVAQAEPQ